MRCLERDLSSFHLPIEEKKCTLAAKKSSKWFSRVVQAAERCRKRWFVKERENAAKRRALEVQSRWQLNQDAVGPQGQGGGRKRSRVERGVAAATAAASPVRKVQAPAETWHWPSF